MTTIQAPELNNASEEKLRPLPRMVRQYVAAGRAFIQSYRMLSKGEQAAVRRDDPLLQEPFWRCANRAATVARAFGVQREVDLEHMVQTLAQMAVLLNLKSARFDDACGNDLGHLLQDNKLTDRRIEAVLTEKSAASLLTTLEATLQIGSQKIDFGVLLGDLVQFSLYPSAARQRWAFSLYSNWKRKPQEGF